ncbi:hypothetical protein [Streptomyces violascens]|uniref:hypothetical protein n=1 Tax=Streptomyces violascens TaxID=67381 RepID=UPI00167A520C|nr:hypothetical protein [Streptomyces violascens]GGU38305.1 hypothetical protein GCM10010289_69130 [Streptomyces violascens]
MSIANTPIEQLLERALLQAASVPPAYDPANSARSGPDLVNWHLRRLGIGDIWLMANGLGHSIRVDGLGWCRAEALEDAFWPDQADLCVAVTWFPDRRFQRRYLAGTVPQDTEDPWRERTDAVITAIESTGFVAEERGPRRTPHHHSSNKLLVYRIPNGLSPQRQPPDAWAGIEPCPPNFRRKAWYPDKSPQDAVQEALDGVQEFARPRYRAPHVPAGTGVCLVRDVTQLVWPVGAELCAHLIWRPAPEFGRTADGALPSGAAEHWTARLAQITDTLSTAGWQVRQRTRPWAPHRDDCADLLVWRPAR